MLFFRNLIERVDSVCSDECATVDSFTGFSIGAQTKERYQQKRKCERMQHKKYTLNEYVYALSVQKCTKCMQLGTFKLTHHSLHAQLHTLLLLLLSLLLVSF